jgi:7,8-dihydropterin-6-yl-methyl-4-(beta-D-ribofuranosyl)aminobenzene 5'-phosphate synthase
MPSIPTPLRPVDRVDVTVIVDLSVDILLPSAGPARRPPLRVEWSSGDQLRAEHGYSVLVQTWIGDETHSLVYDAGLSPGAFQWNCDVLEIRPAEIEAILLSHGHADHHGGLEAVFRRYGRPALPVVLHPDARLERRVVFPTGWTIHMPPPTVNDLEQEGARVLDEPGPTLWGGETMLLSGRVERKTSYEQGYPLQQKFDGTAWVPDPWIWDDQNLIVNVRDRGLVVVSACSHAGSVNVLRNARRLAGEDRVHAFVGGMHLTGGIFEGIIPSTLDDLSAIQPDYIVPGHCTGYRALAEIVTRFPDRYLASSVGSRYSFTA